MNKAILFLVCLVLSISAEASESAVFATSKFEWTRKHTPLSLADAKMYCSSQGDGWELPDNKQLWTLRESLSSLPDSIKHHALWNTFMVAGSDDTFHENETRADGYKKKYFLCVKPYSPEKSTISYSESKSERIARESKEYQSSEKHKPISQPKKDVRLTMFEVINECSENNTFKIFNEYADCVRQTYNSRGTSPTDNSVKAFYIFLDEIIAESNKNTYGFAKEKGEMLRAWQSTIDADNKQRIQTIRQQQGDVAIINAAPIGNNCELAKAQAYLTPAPSGSFADSQRYADMAYASCMANQPIPPLSFEPRAVNPPTNNSGVHYFKGQWVENGQQMCKYDDGTVINIGAGMCPQ